MDHDQRQRLRSLDRDTLELHQLNGLNELLDTILPENSFYQHKLGEMAASGVDSLKRFRELPVTTKQELVVNDPVECYAANLTWPIDRYVRYHRTSGTSGRPMVVLDTAEDWQWWMRTWQFVLDSVELTSSDRVLMAFSFGPFIGFWSAHDACVQRGCLVIPGGGMSSLARLELMQSSAATVFFATPSYAIHLAQVAAEHNIDIAASSISRIVVAGEPGGSNTSVRHKIESEWNARLIDHSGASEVGPWGFAAPDGRGLFVNEAEFIAEFLPIDRPGGANAVDAEDSDDGLRELVLTTLGRTGCPVIRYRTGDLVRPVFDHQLDCRFVLLDGGVLGRVDDMLVIRGVNIYPSSIEQVLRSFSDVVEYRMIANKNGAMDSLMVEVEDTKNDPQRIATELNLRIGLKFDVRSVPAGSLPRFEAKGKRFIDNRTS